MPPKKMKKLNIEFFHVYQRSGKFKRWFYTLQCHENYLLFIRAVFQYYRRQFYNPFQLSLISVNNNTLQSPSYSSLFPRSSSPSFSSTLLIILSILVLLGVAALLILKTCHRRSLSMSHYKHFVLPISRTPSTVLEERQVRTTYVKNPYSCVVTYIKRERSVVVIILPRPVTSRPHATRVREQ